ncbi:hexaprenyldihydroxybenzoate methyltransferase [Moniliophthora roreri]|uniref:Methyltransferase domain-containing protein n=1 Tax=Moniliophthora roreri TaxID=221103 RepID=A0A0W0FUP0_MONRR|nr:hexaprenyldihydroxybenzoate methyltransferase [Moniliophthora roreri]
MSHSHSHHHREHHGHHGHDFAASNRAHFNAHAETYDEFPGAKEVTKKIGEAILQTIPFDKESTTVLDFACLVSSVLVPQSKFLLGVDISEAMIVQFTKRFAAQGLSADKVKGMAKELKGEPGELDGMKFDIVTCSAAYHHFDPSKLQNITNTLASFLKPGGYLFIFDFEPTEESMFEAHNSSDAVKDGAVGTLKGFSESVMRSLYEGSGLTESFEYSHITTFGMRGADLDIFMCKARKPVDSMTPSGL